MAFLFLHAGHHLDAGTVFSWWTWDPFVILLLAVSGALYAVGLSRLWRRAGVGQGIRRWQAACFAGGWLALVVALISPLDALGGILFSAHMAQHEVLMVIAAPLLVMGRPLIAFLWAIPTSWRTPVARVTQQRHFAAAWSGATSPLVAATVHGLALWIWHAPSLYQA